MVDIDVPAPRVFAFSADERHLATSSWSNGVELFALEGGVPVRRALSERSPSALVFTRDGEVLVGADETQVMLWDITSRELLAAIPFSSSAQPSAIAVRADLSAIVVSAQDGGLYRLDIDGDLVRDRLCAIARGEISAATWAAIVPGVEQFDPCAG